MQGNTNGGIIADRNFALTAQGLAPAFDEVRLLLGGALTLFPCKNSQQATKTCIEKTLRALQDNIEWQLEFPLLQSPEPARAELIRALEELEKARVARTKGKNRVARKVCR